jgi:hypothetical protein
MDVPRWLAVGGWLLLPGTLLLGGRLLYEKAILSWSQGPQMVGFSFFHRTPVLALFALFSFAGAHIWLLGLAITLALRAGRRTRLLGMPWLLPVLLVSGLAAAYLPQRTALQIVSRLFGVGRHGIDHLIVAAAQGDESSVRRLLAAGVDVNAATAEGDRPILAAARGGHLPTLQFLIERGADPRGLGRFNETALWGAAEAGHTEAVRILLGLGVDVAVRGPGGMTRGEAARSNGHNDVVSLLRTVGATEPGSAGK